MYSQSVLGQWAAGAPRATEVIQTTAVASSVARIPRASWVMVVSGLLLVVLDICLVLEVGADADPRIAAL